MAEDREKTLNQKEVGRRLRARREQFRMSREQLAEEIEVSYQFIKDIEYGNRGMSLETLYRVSKVLQISSDFFLRGEEKESEPEEEMAILRDAINEDLEGCSVDQLRNFSQMIRLYNNTSRLK